MWHGKDSLLWKGERATPERQRQREGKSQRKWVFWGLQAGYIRAPSGGRWWCQRLLGHLEAGWWEQPNTGVSGALWE